MFRKQDKFTWWMPKDMVRLTFYGSPQTKLRWVLGTWRAYFYYCKVQAVVWKCFRNVSKNPHSISVDGKGKYIMRRDNYSDLYEKQIDYEMK